MSNMCITIFCSEKSLCDCLYFNCFQAMEATGNFKKAAVAYELARDYEGMIRITLDRLNDPQEAVKIVQETRSIEGAKMIAKLEID